MHSDGAAYTCVARHMWKNSQSQVHWVGSAIFSWLTEMSKFLLFVDVRKSKKENGATQNVSKKEPISIL